MDRVINEGNHEPMNELMMNRPWRCAVFCGARTGLGQTYLQAAQKLGLTLAQAGVGLVYGGGKVGLMGALADAVLAQGGEAIGVITRGLLSREVGHAGLTSLQVVDSLSERKARMAALADAFIAMPGAYGTLDELFEVITWRQLGLIDKPCALWNFEGYFDHLLAFIEHSVAEGLLHPAHRELLLVETDPSVLLMRLHESLLVQPS